MTKKNKALVYNFLGFALIFIIVRLGMGYFLEIGRIYISIISAVAAMALAPKFGIAIINGEEKLMMKSIFLKGFKEL